MVSDICTTMIGITLGRMWPSRMRTSPLPESRAASHEAGLAPHIRLGSGDPGVEREVDDRRGDDDVGDRIAERGDDAHGEHEQRERHDGVGDAADDAVGPAAEEAGRDAGQPAEHEQQRDREHRNGEVEPRRHHDAAQDVAPELIGAEPMRRRGRLQRGVVSLASGS